MVNRIVEIGVLTYTRADGMEGAFALQGAEVDVHPDDLERVDRLNVGPLAEPEPEDDEPDSAAVDDEATPVADPDAVPDPEPDGEEPVDLTTLKLPELLDYAGANDIDLEGATLKADVLAKIQAFEAAQAADQA